MVKQNKDVVEFLTISAEYCAFLEQAQEVELRMFADKALKILALLYLKANLLPEFEEEDNAFVEKYVTEQDWNLIHTMLLEKFGEHNNYFDITEVSGFSIGETVNIGIAEAFADIFQDLRDFIQIYREGTDESVAIAVNECKESFKEYWGVRVLGLLQELHLLLYGSLQTEK